VSEQVIVATLRDFGCTERESQVYMQLAKADVQKAMDVASGLKMHKAQVYTILKKLQALGFVESTLESPMRFSATPFSQLVDLQVHDLTAKASALAEQKDALLAHWRAIHSPRANPDETIERFMVIKGRTRIYAKITDMANTAERTVLAVINDIGLIRAEQAGLIQGLSREDTAHFQVIAHVTPQNAEIVAQLAATLSPHITIRHRDMGSGLTPRFIVRDDEEAIFFLQPNISEDPQRETGLWTDSEEIINALSLLHAKFWTDSTDLPDQVRRIDASSSTG
jgi:sugar-specific transcriptional regulator TrmB